MRSILLFLISLTVCKSLYAQQGAVYPDASVLRIALLQMIAEKPEAFRNVKGDLAYKKGNVTFYNATLHLSTTDTPRVVEESNPLQATYLDFLAKGVSVTYSKLAFQKWQDLIQLALPEYNMQVSGDQYTEMEGLEFVSPDRATVFNLYRSGSGNACQVALTIVNDNPAELRHIENETDDDGGGDDDDGDE